MFDLFCLCVVAALAGRFCCVFLVGGERYLGAVSVVCKW